MIDLNTPLTGTQTLTVVAAGGKDIELDGFALVSPSGVGQVVFRKQAWDPKPEIIRGPRTNTLVLKYRDAVDYYGLTWAGDQFEVREFFSKDLDLIFPLTSQNHVNNTFRGEGDGHYTDVFLRPVTLEPHSRRIIYGMVCNGSRAGVEKRLAAPEQSAQASEAIYAAARTRLPDLKPTEPGDSFEFSQQRMAATLLCNVVYPVYTQRSYIKHNTPGKWWDMPLHVGLRVHRPGIGRIRYPARVGMPQCLPDPAGRTISVCPSWQHGAGAILPLPRSLEPESIAGVAGVCLSAAEAILRVLRRAVWAVRPWRNSNPEF